MPGFLTRMLKAEKLKANSKPKAMSESRARVEVRNDADHPVGVYSIRGHFVRLDPGETRAVTVSLKEAYRMQIRQLLTQLTVLGMEKLESVETD